VEVEPRMAYRRPWLPRPSAPATLTLASATLAVLLFVAGVPLFDFMEMKAYDLRLLSRPKASPTPTTILALIDEKSLEREGRWPWPRAKLARMIDILSEDGAAVIGFDIGFLEPDENSRLALLDDLGREIVASGVQGHGLLEVLRVYREDADNDAALAEAIRRSPAKVVLGYFFHMERGGLDFGIDEGQRERLMSCIRSSQYPMVLCDGRVCANHAIVEAYAPVSNLEVLSRAAESSGYYSVKSDADGVVRWMPLAIQCDGEVFPPLSLQCVWHYLGRPQMMLQVGRYGVEGVLIGDRRIPTDSAGQFLINYLGPPKTFPSCSVTDILNRNFEPGLFKGRIVIVGATAMGTHDIRSTPVSPMYPGVEIHVTAIDNILTGNFLKRPGWATLFGVAAIVVLCLGTGLVLPRVRPLLGLAWFVGAFALYLLASHFALASFSIWLNMVYPLLGLTLTFTSLTVYHFVTEQRERLKVSKAFKQYVPEGVIDEMLKDPARLTLGGEEKVLTVLFNDLAGFTSYSEQFSPTEITSILGEYYEVMTEEVFAVQGTLEAYVGDELIALYGAPLEQPDHARRACLSALAMQKRRRTLAQEWAKIGRPPLKARTGINTGPMLVGNLGCKYRFCYGMLGDHVNLASRLEGLNKMYGTEILIGENTAAMVEGEFVLREVDQVRVKGKLIPVRVFELVAGYGEPLPEQKQSVLTLYAEGLKAYRKQDWLVAENTFNHCLELDPDDGPSRVMIQRCRIFMQDPPPADWDGVFEHKTK
jgi:adenylate cyclase